MIIFSVAMHELGHAIAMRKAGVKIKSISLFGFGSLFVSWHSKFFDCRVGFAPIPFGAYVMPKEEDYEDKLSYKDRDLIALAGVRINFFLAALSLLFGIVFYQNTQLLATFMVVALLCSSLFLLRSIVVVLMPLVGIYLIYISFTPEVISLLVEKGTSGITADRLQEVGNLIAEGTPLVVILLNYTTGINLFLGLMNLIPLRQLDGGRVLFNFIKKYITLNSLALACWEWASIFFLLWLSLLPLAGDIRKIFSYLL